MHKLFHVTTDHAYLKPFDGTYQGTLEAVTGYLHLELYFYRRDKDRKCPDELRDFLVSLKLEELVPRCFAIREHIEAPETGKIRMRLPSANRVKELQNMSTLAFNLADLKEQLKKTCARKQNEGWVIPSCEVQKALDSGLETLYAFSDASHQLLQLVLTELKGCRSG